MLDIVIKLSASTVSLLSLCVYVQFAYSKVGLTKSISETFEKLEDKYKKYFIYFSWGISLPLLAYCFSPTKPALVIGCGLVALVGALPYSTDKRIKPYHTMLALGGASIFVIGMWIFMGLWLPTVVLIIVGAIALYMKLWWAVHLLEYLAVVLINISLVNSVF